MKSGRKSGSDSGSGVGITPPLLAGEVRNYSRKHNFQGILNRCGCHVEPHFEHWTIMKEGESAPTYLPTNLHDALIKLTFSWGKGVKDRMGFAESRRRRRRRRHRQKWVTIRPSTIHLSIRPAQISKQRCSLFRVRHRFRAFQEVTMRMNELPMKSIAEYVICLPTGVHQQPTSHNPRFSLQRRPPVRRAGGCQTAESHSRRRRQYQEGRDGTGRDGKVIWLVGCIKWSQGSDED